MRNKTKLTLLHITLTSQLWYGAGTTVTITASAEEGHTFTGWKGNYDSTKPTVAVMMTSVITETATFT
jgi:hypothetical protein